MIDYCDTSVFVQSLLPGPFRAQAQAAIIKIGDKVGTVPLSGLSRFEVVQSLRFESWRFRNNRTQGTPAAQVDAALNTFLAEIGATFKIVSLDWDDVLDRAERLTRSTPERGWRSMDILQVAAALAQNAENFYSLDQLQNELAQREGMKTPLALLIS
jgi:predicted nucleic acid-binding protein